MKLFKRHKHKWGPWEVKEVKVSNGKISFNTSVQVRQCKDKMCQFREIKDI